MSGENALKISISPADGAQNRPGGFSGAFYNTQGRKFNQCGKCVTVVKGDLWIPADWATKHRRSDMWATAFNVSNAVSFYGIIGFANIDGSSPTLRYWNGAVWVNLANPIAYDAWTTFEISLVGADLLYKVNGVTVATIPSNGSVYFGEVIMQAFNFNDNTLGTAYDPSADNAYDAFWDSLISASATGNIVTNTNTGQTFCSIQSAIDDPNTLNGHTISVADGTYTESVNVSKSLNLRGVQADDCATTRAGAESIIICANGIGINADNVTINGFMIKGQTAFAQYIAGFGWLGSLQFMEPPKGYQLKISNAGTLIYPPQPPNKPSVKPQPSLLAPHFWQVDATQFEHSMTLVGMFSAGGQNATLAGHEIGAFAGGQLRGAAQALYIEPLGAYQFFLTTYANTSGEQLQFQLYDSTTGTVQDLTEKMYFVSDLHQGSVQSPVPFTLKTSGLAEVGAEQYLEVQPNPFSDATMIRFASEQAQEVRLLISDATRRTVLSQKIVAAPGMNTFRWEAVSASAGVYFVRLEAGEGTAVRKVVKE